MSSASLVGAGEDDDHAMTISAWRPAHRQEPGFLAPARSAPYVQTRLFWSTVLTGCGGFETDDSL
jgi:hypothetical protein